MALHKRSGGALGPDAGGIPVDDAFRKTHPDLFDFLCCSSWPDGKPRERGTLLVFINGARWQAMLNDKDAELTCFVTADTLKDALLAAEKALGEGKGDWRPYRTEKLPKRR